MGGEPATPLQDGRLLLLETLGRGGMGTVYRAFDRAEQRLVAVKVPSTTSPPGPGHPLAREFDRWAHLRHPNIVRAYEMGHAETGPIPAGTPYLVLEHVRGAPVHRALPHRADDASAELLAVEVLSALAHVHAAGLVHRDLKPANVLAGLTVRRGAGFKLTDFGLAARVGERSEAGTVSGSLPYVAPETLLGLPVDGRCDLYGLGVLLYRLVTGQMPVPGGGAREVLRWHLEGPAADPSRIRPGIGRRMSRFIRRLTMRDRSERPTSAVRALELLGIRGRLPAPRPALAARGTLAALRLALDATRLGARRFFPLPETPEIADAVSRELSVWSQVRGLRFYRVGARVDRLVQRLLAEPGARADAVHRHGLERWLPLETLGDLPLMQPALASVEAVTVRRAAHAICELVLERAETRPVVLCFEQLEPDDRNAELAKALRERLVRSLGRRPRGCTSSPPGGLLLVA